jgi:hypothetical protein
MTFSDSTGTKSGTYMALDCSPAPGTGKLLDYDPAWSKTHIFPPTSTSTPTPTTPPSSGGGGTNVGAIAGGAVGGVAALALVGLGVFLLLRKKKPKDGSSPPPAPMAQTQPPQQSPPLNYTAVPQQGYPGYPAQGYNQNTQSVYDPHMSVYSQPSPYSPQQQGYPPFQQQQQAYNYATGTGTYPGSPQTLATSSPLDSADKGTTSPQPTSPGLGQGQQQAPTELAVQHPVGNERNRAELGGI